MWASNTDESGAGHSAELHGAIAALMSMRSDPSGSGSDVSADEEGDNMACGLSPVDSTDESDSSSDDDDSDVSELDYPRPGARQHNLPPRVLTVKNVSGGGASSFKKMTLTGRRPAPSSGASPSGPSHNPQRQRLITQQKEVVANHMSRISPAYKLGMLLEMTMECNVCQERLSLVCFAPRDQVIGVNPDGSMSSDSDHLAQCGTYSSSSCSSASKKKGGEKRKRGGAGRRCRMCGYRGQRFGKLTVEAALELRRLCYERAAALRADAQLDKARFWACCDPSKSATAYQLLKDTPALSPSAAGWMNLAQHHQQQREQQKTQLLLQPSRRFSPANSGAGGVWPLGSGVGGPGANGTQQQQQQQQQEVAPATPTQQQALQQAAQQQYVAAMAATSQPGVPASAGTGSAMPSMPQHPWAAFMFQQLASRMRVPPVNFGGWLGHPQQQQQQQHQAIKPEMQQQQMQQQQQQQQSQGGSTTEMHLAALRAATEARLRSRSMSLGITDGGKLKVVAAAPGAAATAPATAAAAGLGGTGTGTGTSNSNSSTRGLLVDTAVPMSGDSPWGANKAAYPSPPSSPRAVQEQALEQHRAGQSSDDAQQGAQAVF
eukprot:g2881.t1